jgi:hypothetical protein
MQPTTPSAGKPGDRARIVKLKKWGLSEEHADSKSKKKTQLLSTYQGPHQQTAEATIRDLLGLEAQAS